MKVNLKEPSQYQLDFIVRLWEASGPGSWGQVPSLRPEASLYCIFQFPIGFANQPGHLPQFSSVIDPALGPPALVCESPKVWSTDWWSLVTKRKDIVPIIILVSLKLPGYLELCVASAMVPVTWTEGQAEAKAEGFLDLSSCSHRLLSRGPLKS